MNPNITTMSVTSPVEGITWLHGKHYLSEQDGLAVVDFPLGVMTEVDGKTGKVHTMNPIQIEYRTGEQVPLRFNSAPAEMSLQDWMKANLPPTQDNILQKLRLPDGNVAYRMSNRQRPRHRLSDGLFNFGDLNLDWEEIEL